MSFPKADALELLLEEVQEAVCGLDPQLRVTFINAYARRFWRREAREVLGQPAQTVVPNLDSSVFLTFLQSAMHASGRVETQVFSDTAQTSFHVVAFPHPGGLYLHARELADGSLKGVSDPTNDALTGCMMRAPFLAAAGRTARPAALAVMDLNHLKAINELRGHVGGDTYIRTFARALRRVLPPGALICRWGGDEFVALLPGERLSTLEAWLGRVGRETTPLIDDALPNSGTSAFEYGLAELPTGDTPFERAFAVADEGLHQAKRVQREGGPGERNALAVVAFSRYLETLETPEEVVQGSLKRLLELLEFELGYFSVWEAGNSVVQHVISTPDSAVPEMLNTAAFRGPVAAGGLTRRVWLTEQTVSATDYPAEPAAYPELVALGVKSVVLVPVRRRGRVGGVLGLLTLRRWRTVTPQVKQLVELAALRLGHALELRRVVGEVRSNVEAGLLGLGVALEARDLETHGHTRRVATLAMRLAQALNLPERDSDHLRDGAYLHDLGKLMIPDAILLKPGKLTPEEWEVMQSHTVRGRELAAQIPHLAPEVLDVIAHHHERWDGTGYPSGLRGEQIPMLAQVFSVCDVFDALVSERPYKAAWSVEAALEEIDRQAGRQFCPHVVSSFLKLMREQTPPDVLPPGTP